MSSLPDWLIFILLFASLAFSFWRGIQYASRRQNQPSSQVNKGYLEGLNYLLNEQPDAAIDAFVKSLEVNSETLETHLALGNLLRRRGEADRAIRIHQNLLARSNLTVEQQQQVEYELAVDFIKSGLFDRAERLLTDLLKRDGVYKKKSLQTLMEMYQAEKEWQLALDAANELCGSRFNKSNEQWASIRAHFSCEIAEGLLEKGDVEQAKHYIKLALGFDKGSLRANLLISNLELQQGNARKAVGLLKKLSSLHPAYINEILPVIQKSYTELNDSKSYLYFLESFYAQFRGFTVLSSLADSIEQEQGVYAAAEYVAGEVKKEPSLKGVNKLLGFYLALSEESTKEHLHSLKTVLVEVLDKTKKHQCNACGFKTERLHWLCPTCKTWDGIQPVELY